MINLTTLQMMYLYHENNEDSLRGIRTELKKKKYKHDKQNNFIYDGNEIIKSKVVLFQYINEANVYTEYNTIYFKGEGFTCWSYKTLLGQINKKLIKIVKKRIADNRKKRLNHLLEKIDGKVDTIEGWLNNSDLKRIELFCRKLKLNFLYFTGTLSNHTETLKYFRVQKENINCRILDYQKRFEV